VRGEHAHFGAAHETPGCIPPAGAPSALSPQGYLDHARGGPGAVAPGVLVRPCAAAHMPA
jgi:hypothetical protein